MSDSKSEYASGFSGPAASHLAAPPSPRHEGNVGQAPRFATPFNGRFVEYCDEGNSLVRRTQAGKFVLIPMRDIA
jgi:hypothetical protein